MKAVYKSITYQGLFLDHSGCLDSDFFPPYFFGLLWISIACSGLLKKRSFPKLLTNLLDGNQIGSMSISKKRQVAVCGATRFFMFNPVYQKINKNAKILKFLKLFLANFGMVNMPLGKDLYIFFSFYIFASGHTFKYVQSI